MFQQKYQPKGHQTRRIEAAFHEPRQTTEEQEQRLELIRLNFKALSHALVTQCPNSRELNSSLKCLEEACWFACEAIVRNE